jgi:hypothetical protein
VRAGFTVRESHVLDWGEATGLDAVTLLEKVGPNETGFRYGANP